MTVKNIFKISTQKVKKIWKKNEKYKNPLGNDSVGGSEDLSRAGELDSKGWGIFLIKLTILIYNVF